MTVQPGTRLGPYEIVSRIGAGGMGEVWNARDTRLERSVAVKILPAEFARNVQLKLRFDREAKMISQLEHAHICRLYDVGDTPVPANDGSASRESVPYLVMELLEGESLADRLARGPLPLPEVLRFGMQIAEALHRAHRAGVVHRDLKPGNVMITKSGAKLLDFGLSKSGQQPQSGALPSVMVTEAKPLTEQGTILGTFQYMAPEQVDGSEADSRTDIFAFGALLYEMATGRRAFDGKTRASLIAAIVAAEPRPVSELVPLTPPALEHIIRKCLCKEPEDRWQSAHDIASELRWISEAGSQAGVASPVALRRVHRERMAWGAALVALLAAIAAGVAWVRRAPEPAPMQRFVVAPPPAQSLVPFDEMGMELSPDGRRLAFVALGSDGRRRLWVRSFSDFEAQALPETSNAVYPFWSPDGRFIAFFADGKLKKIDAAGGPPQVICDAPSGRGGVWGADGTILIAPNIYSGIYSVPASGGTPVAVTKLDPATEVTHRWPHFLPGGKHFFYVVRPKAGDGGRGPGRLMIGALDGSPPKELLREATNTVYLDGHILFGREQRLMAQKFDLDDLKLVGDAFVLAGEKLSYWEPKNLIVFSATRHSLVYLPEAPPLQDLRLLSREGRELETIAAKALLNYGATFSPDGTRIAYSLGEGGASREDIWLHDAARKRSSRFTFQPGSYFATSWAPDGSRLYFGSSPQSMGNVYEKPLKGGGSVRPVVVNSFWKLGAVVSPDGRTIIYTQQSAGSRYDLWVIRDGGKPEVLRQTPFDEADPRFSPDGRWISFTSDESGRAEVYVRPAAGEPDQWQVSAAGGSAARWRADGRELIYISPEGQILSVQVQTSPSFEVGEARELFRLDAAQNIFSTPLQDVSPDGQQILVLTDSDNAAATMRVTFGWQQELAKSARK